MKILLLSFISIFILFGANGQSRDTYQKFIARASLCHLQKNYKKAIIFYEEAFAIESPDAITAYKAAGVYSLNNNIDMAFGLLLQAIKSGWFEADMLSTDPYFEHLKETNPHRWEQIVNQAFAAEKGYEKGLREPALRKQINLMVLIDQRLRYARVQAESNEGRQKINYDIHLSDSINRIQAKDILSKYGWPKLSDIGRDGQNNLWLIVQHADDDVFFQQTALSAMLKLKNTEELNLENYAYLYDRVKCNLNYKQFYGTQVNWSTHGQADSFKSIIDENSIDDRRKDMGMVPLEIYALTYGFVYHKKTKLQVKMADLADRASVGKLIDSAKYFYAKGVFYKVYDFYNTASTYLGGMNNADNYDAALIFAGIANKDYDSKYKAIALDFLNLLYQRNKLRKKQLSGNIFKVLHKDQRWIDIYNHID